MALKKTVIITGLESSGSRFVAKIIAQVTGAAGFDDWNAYGWVRSDHVDVCHRSMPYGSPGTFPDVERWIKTYGATTDLRFVLTTRDRTLSEVSKIERFGKSKAMVESDTATAIGLYRQILNSGIPAQIVSYETLMLLGKDYLDQLYSFLGVETDFCPEFRDGNAARLADLRAAMPSEPDTAKRRRMAIRGTARNVLNKLSGESD